MQMAYDNDETLPVDLTRMDRPLSLVADELEVV
jgi:hypothetical protein